MQRTWIVLGERVGLTAFEREEFVARWDAYNDPEIGMLMSFPLLAQYPAPMRPPVTREDRERVWEVVASRAVLGFDVRAAEDGRSVGECSLSKIAWPRGSAEIAIAILDRADRGQGYGTEAVQLLAAYAFDGYGLRRVTLRYLAINPAVVAACERSAEAVGGRVVGVEREAEWAYGAHQDCVIMEILARDFPPHPATAHLREAPARLELPS